ncbi:KH domain family protein [Brugia pahangi]
MSNSEKKSGEFEAVANLDLEESEAIENSNTGKTMRSVASINSNNRETMKSVTDSVKDKGKPEITIAAASESDYDDSEQQQYFNQDLKDVNEEYLARLIKEKEDLGTLPSTFRFKHAIRLVDEEIAKIHENLEQSMEVNGDGMELLPGIPTQETYEDSTMDEVSITTNGKVFLQEKIFVPVNEYPNYNFVGRILGPRGMTAKQLEEESGCRIMIRGRGSIREDAPQRQNIHNDHMKEELHVLVQCEDFEERAKAKMKRAVDCIRSMLIPPAEGEDELKRKQLMELSIINGTYRPTIASRTALRNYSLFPQVNFGQIGVGNTIYGMNNFPMLPNSGVEGNKYNAFYDPRAGVNFPYNYAQQYQYNVYTANTRQALASLGFDMDAFEISDCYGKRMGRASAGVSGNHAATTNAAAFAAQYPGPCGYSAPLMDPFVMQGMWNPAINSPMFGINASNPLAREYYNHVMTGLAQTINSNGVSIGNGMLQSSSTPPVNLQQYLTAAALLSGAPNFRTDGSGDGPNDQH